MDGGISRSGIWECGFGFEFGQRLKWHANELPGAAAGSQQFGKT